MFLELRKKKDFRFFMLPGKKRRTCHKILSGTNECLIEFVRLLRTEPLDFPYFLRWRKTPWPVLLFSCPKITRTLLLKENCLNVRAPIVYKPVSEVL